MEIDNTYSMNMEVNDFLKDYGSFVEGEVEINLDVEEEQIIFYQIKTSN